MNEHMNRNSWIKYLSLEYISYVIKCMHKQINKYDCLSKINDCTHWHFNPPELLFYLCVLSYFSFMYTCICVFLRIKSPLRECRSIRSGASGLPYYCAPLVCVSVVMELLAVWRHNKPKTKNQVDGEGAKLRRPSWLTAATKSGASGPAERLSMMPFGLCICQATWRQPRAAASGCTAENPQVK